MNQCSINVCKWNVNLHCLLETHWRAHVEELAISFFTFSLTKPNIEIIQRFLQLAGVFAKQTIPFDAHSNSERMSNSFICYSLPTNRWRCYRRIEINKNLASQQPIANRFYQFINISICKTEPLECSMDYDILRLEMFTKKKRMRRSKKSQNNAPKWMSLHAANSILSRSK